MKWAYAINFFLAGIIIGFILFDLQVCTFSFEINLIDTLGVLVTLFFGFYIADSLTRRLAENRIEKDLVIKHVTELDEQFMALYGAYKRNETRTDSLISQTDSVATKLVHIESLMRECNFMAADKLTDLRTKEKNFRQHLTGASVANGSFNYDDPTRVQIEALYSELESLTAGLIIQLNRI